MASQTKNDDQQKADEQQKQADLQKQVEQQKGDPSRKSHDKSGAQRPEAGPIVSRDPADVEHDERVRKGEQASSEQYSIEVPGLPVIPASSLQGFKRGELNQKIDDFVVNVPVDASMEEWWRQTELYKDEPTASSYKKDVTLRTLDDNGREVDSHIIKGVYPKRRVETPNGSVEYTFAGDFVAASASTRKREDNADAPYFTHKTGNAQPSAADVGSRPTNPSKPSPKSETA